MSARVPLYGEVGVREEQQEPDARGGRQPYQRRRPTASKNEPTPSLAPYTVVCENCFAKLRLAFAWSAATCGFCGEKLAI